MTLNLNIKDSIAYLGEGNFSVSLEHSSYRRLLYLNAGTPAEQKRIGRYFDASPGDFPWFFTALALWLSTDTHRLLWIDHFSTSFPSQLSAFTSILGDTDLHDKPGILLGPLPSDPYEEVMATTSEAKEAEKLINLCSLLAVGEWDAKLVAKGSTDYVEFWEGNVYFYSSAEHRLDQAEKIFDQYRLGTKTQ